MRINLAGIVVLSTIDWFGKSAMVIFLRGCPMKCPHCHNEIFKTGVNLVKDTNITSRMLLASQFVDHVVISGGEPSIQVEACRYIIEQAHGMSMKVAIETCGSSKLVDGFDAVFLSIKTSRSRPAYKALGGHDQVFDNIMSNLARMHPSRSEIRLTLFADSVFDFSTFGPLQGFPIRVTLGVGIGCQTTEKRLNEFCNDLAQAMNYEIVENGNLRVLLRPKK